LASNANRVYGIGWAVFGAAVLIASWRMDRLESLHINPWSAPGVMPGVLGALMLVFGITLALRRGGEVAALDASPRRTALALVLCIAFAGGLLGRGLPFWLTAATFLFVSILAFRLLDPDATPRWRVALSSAVIAVCAALIISFVFEDLFLVRLP
jgi:putative tricarboxylic transport membrane protein